MDIKKLLYKDVEYSINYWSKQVIDALYTDNDNYIWEDCDAEYKHLKRIIIESDLRPDELELLINELSIGVIHSFFTIIDGATKLAEFEKLNIVDSTGKSIGDGLHETFIEYMYREK